MLSRSDAVLMVVDIQGKLAQLMRGKEALFENVRRMIRGANVLGIPVIWAEQNPKGLGPTVPEIAEMMTGIKPIPKLSFSCCGEDAIASTLQELGRRQVLLAGIEAHVCVYQTAMDLVRGGTERGTGGWRRLAELQLSQKTTIMAFTGRSIVESHLSGGMPRVIAVQGGRYVSGGTCRCTSEANG